MKSELFKFIEKLSNKDPKTLMQKTLKTAEECGELAKAVLPFTEAPQSTHKFSDKTKILEESADVILCALSVAYNLGMTSEEIESMLWKKSEYWASLQAREKNNPFPLPFEIHVTVSKDSDIAKFKEVCLSLGVKAICLELINEKNEHMLDEVMTSSKFYGNNAQVYEEICRISSRLKSEGFLVEREKIETVYWHPSAPSSIEGNKKMHRNGYFESHLDVFISEKDKEKLETISKKHKAVVSQNTRKIYENGSVYILTLRNYSSLVEEFVLQVKALEMDLKKEELLKESDKSMIEFALYDTKISHDREWIKQ